jgi:hypothetical protein
MVWLLVEGIEWNVSVDANGRDGFAVAPVLPAAVAVPGFAWSLHRRVD